MSTTIVLFDNSKADEPVAITCVSGKLSAISFNVNPILLTLCASSSKTNFLPLIKAPKAVEVVFVKDARPFGILEGNDET